MKPTITTQESITLMGFGFFGDAFAQSAEWTEENEIGRLWNRFMTFVQGQPLPTLVQSHYYEVHTEVPEAAEKGYVDVFVGAATTKADGLPAGPLYKVLPAGEYALFTLRGEAIAGDWYYSMLREWLPDAGLRLRWPFVVQRYDERFKGTDRLAESELDILVPVARHEA